VKLASDMVGRPGRLVDRGDGRSVRIYETA